jgi:hypothetical protein
MGLESTSSPAKTSSSGQLNLEVESSLPQDSPQVVIHKDPDSSTKDDLNRLRLTEKSIIITPEDPENPVVNVRDRSTKLSRFGMTCFGLTMLVVGRVGVPEIEVPCVQDRVLEALQFANDFILRSGNEIFRDSLQIICSFIVDITALLTFIYWTRKGTSYRLPLSLILFYVVRAIVQNMFISPFTKGYYWESPGIPSLVVPYGRGSDFFFSGHTGFMVICTLEWHYVGMKKVRNFVAAGALYTMLILMVYQIHYSIDIFTGAFFAEWCHIKIDKYKYEIADAGRYVYNKLLWLVRGKYKASYKGM